jgi:hypothetical protein
MTIKVTVRPTTSVVTSVKQSKTAVSSVNIGPSPSLSLGQLTNVDASDPDDGEALVYDATTNKYIVKELTIDANNIPNIIGGTF